MTNLYEKIFGKKQKTSKRTGVKAMVGHTIESMSHAYKVDEDTVRNIVNDWMSFERAVRAGIYD